MPFKSKAQAGFMFATHPEKAKEWAKETPNMKDLPEKKHPQVNPKRHKLEKGAGMFFGTGVGRPESGRFFRDGEGRSDGTFYEKTAFDYGTGDDGTGGTPELSESVGGQQDAGNESSGGMYGTGQPSGRMLRPVELVTPSDYARSASNVKRPIGGSGERKQKSGPERIKERIAKKPEKVAASVPSDWDADSGLPTGFHRPTVDQPYPLEAGGERFHSTEAKPPDFGAPGATMDSVRDTGRLAVRPTSTHQMGKNASPQRFLGTSFAKTADTMDDAKNWASERAGEAGESLKTLGRDIVGTGGESIQKMTRSPLAMGVATLLGAKMLGHGASRAGRRVARAFGHRPPVKPGMLASLSGGIRKFIHGP